ncbi:MAG: lytic transglycosylase domain-containing protein [Clostridia bacterium]|nr:lytic transglycosylase domain-containing protein [Clostridia bacterium]
MKKKFRPLSKKFFKTISVAIIAAVIFLALLLLCKVFVFPKKYSENVCFFADKYGVERNFVYSVIKCESSFKENAVSDSGAVGIMQIMPKTADFISENFFDGKDYDLFNVDINIEFGVRYIAYLYEKFGDKRSVLAAYNAGEGNVKKWLSDKKYSVDGVRIDITPFAETNDYISRVMTVERIYGILYGSE